MLPTDLSTGWPAEILGGHYRIAISRAHTLGWMTDYIVSEIPFFPDTNFDEPALREVRAGGQTPYVLGSGFVWSTTTRTPVLQLVPRKPDADDDLPADGDDTLGGWFREAAGSTGRWARRSRRIDVFDTRLGHQRIGVIRRHRTHTDRFLRRRYTLFGADGTEVTELRESHLLPARLPYTSRRYRIQARDGVIVARMRSPFRILGTALTVDLHPRAADRVDPRLILACSVSLFGWG